MTGGTAASLTSGVVSRLTGLSAIPPPPFSLPRASRTITRLVGVLTCVTMLAVVSLISLGAMLICSPDPSVTSYTRLAFVSKVAQQCASAKFRCELLQECFCLHKNRKCGAIISMTCRRSSTNDSVRRQLRVSNEKASQIYTDFAVVVHTQKPFVPLLQSNKNKQSWVLVVEHHSVRLKRSLNKVFLQSPSDPSPGSCCRMTSMVPYRKLGLQAAAVSHPTCAQNVEKVARVVHVMYLQSHRIPGRVTKSAGVLYTNSTHYRR
ncbi:hypothetical protein BDZ85DRAFT_83168 [Elsinoe ampelina]|uniref:Uncharacterized protein n=1 Tax=Elsinoe ampelina TaxID=302913 RepID=A0A6A6GGS9_9PEZI|nr:hypothetical protein BDZ85DRAFT_83168 [Elsinoe ampelina]